MMSRVRMLPAAIVSFLVLCGVAGAAHAQPAGVPPQNPPSDVPPPFAKGQGGKGNADVSFNCLGVAGSVGDSGSPFAYVADAVELQSGAASVFLEGSASGDLPGDGLVAPVQGAAASIGTQGLALQPFDFCDNSAGSVLSTVVTGSHLFDPLASGRADVEFHVHYHAVLQTEGTGGSFTAYTGTELAVLGVSFDSFEVSASGDIVSAPPGLSVTEILLDGATAYEVSGTQVIPGQLAYGEGATNVVETTFFAGGHLEAVNAQGSSIVAGVAAAEAIDSISYEVVSLDPDVAFSFEEVSGHSADPSAE
jgi:hypothetical protein